MTHPKIERHGEQWRYKKRIPGDLLSHFNGSKFLVFTTKTADQRAARAECVRWLADHESHFQRLRQMPTGGSSVPVRAGLSLQEVGAVLAEEVARFKAEKLAADELTAEGGHMGLGVMSPEFRLTLLGVDPESARLAVQGFPGEWEPFESLALRRMAGVGVPLEASSGAAKSAAMAFARASLEVAEVVRVRAAGGLDSTPSPLPRPAIAAPVAPVAAKGMHKLSEALTPWQAFKKPSSGSVEIYTAGVKVFEERFPDLYAETITKADVKAFVSKRMEEGKSPKTIEKEHGIIRALLTFAVEEGWRTDNPASGVMLPKDTGGRKRRGYKPEELAALFKTDVFTKGDRPIGGKGEAAFWLPLLAVFTGARREELAQLATDRVRVEAGVPYLALDPLDDSGRLKTDESRRAVPLHRELIRLGFLEFVEDCRRAGGGHLFPLLKPNKRGQYAAKFGDWWGRYVRDKAGVEDPMIAPMHSFRHSVITDLRQQRIREDEERQILGHTDRDGRGAQKDSHDGYGEHLVPTLAEVVNMISHRGLDLSGVKPYVSRAVPPICT